MEATTTSIWQGCTITLYHEPKTPGFRLVQTGVDGQKIEGETCLFEPFLKSKEPSMTDTAVESVVDGDKSETRTRAHTPEVRVVGRLQPALAVEDIAELSKKSIEDMTHPCEFE